MTSREFSVYRRPAGFCLSSVIALIILGIIFQCESTEFKPLSCYRCISMECSITPEICALAKSFIQGEAEKHYYTDGYPLPDCPQPNALEEWEELTTKIPSKLACGEFASGQATCVLGRFQIDSLVVETGSNLTSYGSILGCAKKRLLDSVKATTMAKDRRVIESLHSIIGCHSEYGESSVRDSLKHFLRLEHCAQIADMCYTTNYCIQPRFSVPRPFTTNRYNDLDEPSVALFTIFIWVAAVIGIIVAIMTFAGIKYS